MAIYEVAALFWLLAIPGQWKVLTKAGRRGWVCLVPIYGAAVLCRISGRSEWLVVAFLIPLVNIIALAMLLSGLAQAFGKSTGFAVGLFFLSPIFFSILGFGSATYNRAYYHNP